MQTSRTVAVDFQASRGGDAPLSWAHLDMWHVIEFFGDEAASFNFSKIIEIPDGIPQSEAIRSLRELVTHHQSLRTLFTAEGPAGPEQRVQRVGTYIVGVETVPAAEVSSTARSLATALAAKVFQHEEELPCRFHLVVAEGVVRAVVVVASHLTVDGWGMKLLVERLALLLDGGEPSAEAEQWQPLDQVAYEKSPQGQRQERRTLEYWRKALATAPASMFDSPVVPVAGHPFRRMNLSSQAVAAAAERLAAETGTSASSVLLAATALLLRAVNGHDSIVLQLITSNRFRPRQQSMLSSCAQNALFILPEAGTGTFRETIARTHQLSTASYFHSQYSPERLERLRAEIAAARGTEVDLSAFFNDARLGEEWDSLNPGAMSRDDFDKLRAASTLSPVASFAQHDMKFYLDVITEGTACEVSLLADTRLIPSDTCVKILCGLEAVLCEAVFDEIGPDDFSRITAIPAWPRDRDSDQSSSVGDRT